MEICLAHATDWALRAADQEGRREDNSIALRSGIIQGVRSQNQLVDDCEMINVNEVIAMLDVPCS